MAAFPSGYPGALSGVADIHGFFIHDKGISYSFIILSLVCMCILCRVIVHTCLHRVYTRMRYDYERLPQAPPHTFREMSYYGRKGVA